jgi:GT2 family glycosyltransferase
MADCQVVLVNYQGWEDTVSCLKSLCGLNHSSFGIVVIDNCSPNNSFNKIIEWGKKELLYLLTERFGQLEVVKFAFRSKREATQLQIVCIKNDGNGGFARGNNIGVQYLISQGGGFKYVWFLNNDTIVEPNSLSFFIDRFKKEEERNNRLGILGGKLYQYGSPDIFQGIGGRYYPLLTLSKHIGANQKDLGQFDYYDKVYRIDYIIGASMFVSKEFIFDVGPMQEDYFLFFEELDWVYRGKKKGWTIAFEPKVKVWHKDGASTEKNGNSVSLLADTFQVRNRLIFTRRYYPCLLCIALPFVLFSLVNRVLRGQYKRALQIFIIIVKTMFKIFIGKIK